MNDLKWNSFSSLTIYVNRRELAFRSGHVAIKQSNRTCLIKTFKVKKVIILEAWLTHLSLNEFSHPRVKNMKVRREKRRKRKTEKTTITNVFESYSYSICNVNDISTFKKILFGVPHFTTCIFQPFSKQHRSSKHKIPQFAGIRTHVFVNAKWARYPLTTSTLKSYFQVIRLNDK